MTLSAAHILTRNNILLAAGAAVITAYGGLRLYRSSGERHYPTRTPASLPRASALRTLFEERAPLPAFADRTPQPVVVEPHGRWLPSFTAPSHVIPRKTLETYARARLAPLNGAPSQRLDIRTLMQAAVLALGDSLAHRFEVRLGVRGPTAFSLEPGEDESMVAVQPGRGHWNDDFTVVGSWSTSPPAALEWGPLDAIVTAGKKPELPCTVLSNSTRLKVVAANGEPDAAGVMLYWRSERLEKYRIFRWVYKHGMRLFGWRFPLGGLHEVIVEDLPERGERGEELVKVTYATAEVYDLHPNGEKEENWKVIPGWAETLHIDYARSMLKGTISQINTHA
ncbi:hypothetical protein AURDEDRAFT_161173 [Auricularia subglabra TFB-10046 SS5]|nr:hypothetical protein AURDEDRAFT_161173 [Auricularia subglabra TFB-10046 SS5]